MLRCDSRQHAGVDRSQELQHNVGLLRPPSNASEQQQAAVTKRWITSWRGSCGGAPRGKAWHDAANCLAAARRGAV